MKRHARIIERTIEYRDGYLFEHTHRQYIGHWYNLHEAADYLAFKIKYYQTWSKTKVQEHIKVLVRIELLDGIEVGGKWYIGRESLYKWIDDGGEDQFTSIDFQSTKDAIG